MNIIFIAPPAAGKGTQSELLVKKYGLIHISTGDLLRKEVSEQTDLGKSIENIMSTGGLVSDEIVNEVLKKRLSENDINAGIILDGYPRRFSQCESLSNILNELNIKIDAVIYLKMDEELAMKRALGRLSCPKCNRGYNEYFENLQPKVPGICDSCNETLIKRSDDFEKSFRVRFQDYLSEVEPILNYYQDLGILKIIDNSKTPEETFQNIERVI